jgi:chromosome partitioning protein
MSQTKIIALANQKGGVGKTTTAVNLGASLAAAGKKVLLIDIDPQGNATTGLGIEKSSLSYTLYDIFSTSTPCREAICSTLLPGLNLIPSSSNLSGIEMELATYSRPQFILSQSLKAIEEEYDYILMDCPPSLGILTVNALVSAHSVLIPLQCEFYALEGLSLLIRTIELIKKQLNPELHIFGLLLTMYDKRSRLTLQVEEEVRNYFEDIVFKTVIPRNIRLSEAPSYGKPAIIYNHQCLGSRGYLLLAREILQREKEKVEAV